MPRARERAIKELNDFSTNFVFAILDIPHNVLRKSVQETHSMKFVIYQSALPESRVSIRAVFHQRRLIGKFKWKRRIIKIKERVIQLKKKSHSKYRGTSMR